jgi:pyridoxal phosphate enzyme (YggS family)
VVVTGITDHLGEIDARIARATAAATAQGRPAAPVTLVAVSKGHPADAVREAMAAGLSHFGENYLQEALPKITASGRDAVWHFIGRIQSNKTREIATNFAWAQTVTSARIAERLSAQRPHHGEPLQMCIQLEPVLAGPGGEAAGAPRAGCPRGEVAALAALIAGLPRVRLRGLMLLPNAGLDAETLRVEYRAARVLLDELNARGHQLDTLSMGMSDDLEIAIEEGSTMVRVGTALFGERPGKQQNAPEASE